MKKYISLIVIFAITILACNSSDSDASTIDTFHEDYYDVNIAPSIKGFKTELEKQIQLTTAFKADTSQENFENLQAQWLVCAKAFSKMSVYNIVAVKAEFFDVLIYNFSITPSRIETNIAEQTVFNSEYFITKSSVTKGLGALEYLLYNNQNSTEAYTLLTKDEFRVNYLLGVTEEALVKTNALFDFWELGYKETFINATAVSCTENARCLTFNQLINIIDVIRVTKLGKPAGLESSTTDVEGLEAFRSGNSLALIKSSLDEVARVYASSDVNFGALVDEISGNTIVSDAISTAFVNINTTIEAIDTSLHTAILNNDPNVEVLYDELFELVKYFSVDAASVLSVTIIPTDNDGD